ncbi:hypothetical protein [Aquipuribacter hungaricus]|uniref:Uncharacterized protein n=1 Tax=Aquipuribacter hungaricus TaxID=545624 RepID=A0ABV7WM83_9MICO
MVAVVVICVVVFSIGVLLLVFRERVASLGGDVEKRAGAMAIPMSRGRRTGHIVVVGVGFIAFASYLALRVFA